MRLLRYVSANGCWSTYVVDTGDAIWLVNSHHNFVTFLPMSIYDTYNAGLDNPDARDYTAEELFGAIPEIKLPERVILDQTPPLQQGSIGACTVFGSSGALFETISQNLNANGLKYTQPYDPWTVWAKAKERGASDTLGWSIQGAIQLIKDMKLSAGYVRL